MNTKNAQAGVVTVVAALIGLTVAIILGLIIWVKSLDSTIQKRLAGKRWAAPTEFYSAPERIIKGQSGVNKVLEQTLNRLEYKPVLIDKPLAPGEFSRLNTDRCKEKVPELPSQATQCWYWKSKPRKDQTNAQANNGNPIEQLVALDDSDHVVEVYEGTPLQASSVIELEPELFAQFYGGQPVLRQITALSDVPTSFLNACMAIEDSQFLTHSGVSWTGILRAAFRNLIHGGVREGGSTITQQLVKNYFLTQERTFRRKITEILMALLLETRFTKDDILETYVNEVYLGQAGPFEIHGVGVAAKFFFNKQPTDLTLAESALLAGTIRGPRLYSPFNHPDNALKRREQVLKRMLELSLIDQYEYNTAMSSPLPQAPQRLLRDQAPFFIESVKFQLKKMGYENTEGLRVFTTLNLRAQQAATEAVINGLTKLEKGYAAVQQKEEKYKAKLQGVLISADPTNGFVEAVVGGRSFSETQLNRAVLSKRQVGSIFKPFVFLTAFDSKDENGKPYTALTPVLDEPFTVTYDKQSWSPQNYDEEYFGQIPLFMALEKSLNAATSKVALQVGLKNVAKTAAELGIDSALLAVPSLALGSSTLTPLEVLQAYSTLARRGELNPLTFIYRMLNEKGDVLYEFKPSPIQATDPVNTRETIALMEGAIDRGTGRLSREWGFTHPAAGKTGTTSDTKDAWFGGFTPLHAAVVWVGFDQPEVTGLTGAMAALPIWTEYMRNYASRQPPIPFAIPEGAVQLTFDNSCVMEMPPKFNPNATLRLVFKKGQEPNSTCWH